jgi:hypothetical protein
MNARSFERSNHALTASLAASKLAMPVRFRSPALIEVAVEPQPLSKRRASGGMRRGDRQLG